MGRLWLWLMMLAPLLGCAAPYHGPITNAPSTGGNGLPGLTHEG